MLEQSESDKATISRALIQNNRLKQQLEEMENGFVKLVSLRLDCWSVIFRNGCGVISDIFICDLCSYSNMWLSKNVVIINVRNHYDKKILFT